MPRPIFGAVDWWTFEELQNTDRFELAGARAPFRTKQMEAADALAESFSDDEADMFDEDGVLVWPGFEFCVSRGTKTVLMVRRRD